jgi:hypothetical protein
MTSGPAIVARAANRRKERHDPGERLCAVRGRGGEPTASAARLSAVADPSLDVVVAAPSPRARPSGKDEDHVFQCRSAPIAEPANDTTPEVRAAPAHVFAELEGTRRDPPVWSRASVHAH